MQATQQPARRPSLIGPIILIGLGMLFLLGNLGMNTWNVWETLIRLWPVLLIAGGLEIIVGRRNAWAAWLIALLTVALLVGGVVLLPGRTGGAILATDTITQPLGAAERANVDIGFGAGALTVASLNDETNLVTGNLQRRSGEEIRQDFRMAGDTAIFTLRSENRTPWLSQTGRGPTWDIRLNNSVPTQLTIATGAGQSTLDLRQLQLTHLDVSTGAGQTRITLPERGVLDARVSTGAGQAIITIPSGMAARIQVSAGIGSKEVQGSYQRDGDRYVSPNYASATNRVDLEVSGGVGSIVVRQAGN
ncbi:MAG TPA: DUF5668 domain-containing protein [Herpetosiphonaceae bacterium]